MRKEEKIKIRALVFAIFLLVALTGCLDFGQNLETTKPTAAQLKYCKKEMHIKSSLEIIPIGFEQQDTGIDDVIKFKFETNTREIAEIFDTDIVDINKLKKGFTFKDQDQKPQWWDHKGKMLYGGTVDLPNARFMDVGLHETKNGYIVYVEWFET